jgi:hypothetical protein
MDHGLSAIEIAPTRQKKRHGAPLNNINASKNKWATFWRRRVVKEHDKWIIPMLADYSDDLILDKGGAENITAAERRMIEIAQTARRASMLNDCRIALRFCDRTDAARCAICDDYIYAHPLALDFFVTSTQRIICEACALQHGIDLPLWSAARRGIFVLD